MLVLTNDKMGVHIRPEMGARIDQITDYMTGKDWIWHPADYDSTTEPSVSLGTPYDPNWQGGWEEIFPNDATEKYRARQLVDHGELWSQPWQVLEATKFKVQLVIECRTVPVRVTKTVELDSVRSAFRLHYLLENLSDEEFPFMLKQHPAIAIEENDILLLPDCEVEPVSLDFSRRIGQTGPTHYPFGKDAQGENVRLDQMLPRATNSREFFYCSRLARGECGIMNKRTRTRLNFRFGTEQFPFVWVFQSFGGFYGHYVLVLEPATTKFYSLETATQRGTTPILASRQKRDFDMEVDIARM